MKRDIEDLDDSIRKDLREAVSRKEKMEILLASSEYRAMVKLLEQQVALLTRQVLEMPTSQDDLVKKAYSSGQIAGLKIAIDFPSITIEDAQAAIDVAKKLEEEDNENEQREQAREPQIW